MDPSPYKLFSSASNRSFTAKGSAPAPAKKAATEKKKSKRPTTEESHQESSILLEAIHARQLLLQELSATLEEPLTVLTATDLTANRERQVNDKTERLAGTIAQQIGEEVLPKRYKISRTKTTSDKERKGKTLGGRKNWLAID